MNAAVRIGRDLLSGLERAMWQASPYEACGLLLGEWECDTATITQIVITENVTAGDPTVRFEIDPAVHILIQKAAREGAPAIIGVWHSHPGGAAVPSEEDRRQSVEPGWVWLISADGKGRMEHLAYTSDKQSPRDFHIASIEYIDH